MNPGPKRLLVAIGASTAGLMAAGGGWMLWQNAPAPLDQGVVVERRFTPAHWEQYMRPVTNTRPATRTVCSGGFGNTPRTCRTEIYTETYTDYVPDQRWVPDDWDLNVDGCSFNRQGEESCRTEWKDVDEAVYDDCQVGETWRRETACNPQ